MKEMTKENNITKIIKIYEELQKELPNKIQHLLFNGLEGTRSRNKTELLKNGGIVLKDFERKSSYTIPGVYITKENINELIKIYSNKDKLLKTKKEFENKIIEIEEDIKKDVTKKEYLKKINQVKEEILNKWNKTNTKREETKLISEYKKTIKQLKTKIQKSDVIKEKFFVKVYKEYVENYIELQNKNQTKIRQKSNYIFNIEDIQPKYNQKENIEYIYNLNKDKLDSFYKEIEKETFLEQTSLIVKKLKLKLLNQNELIKKIKILKMKNSNIKEATKEIELYLKDIEGLKNQEEKLRLKAEEKLKTLKDSATICDIHKYYKPSSFKREIVLYLGDTNSGKTYDALQEYKNAKNACYLAPLRLLATEIYEDYKEELNISLITGEQRLIKENSTHTSSTIEMVDLNKEYEIAIIDEIQMIGDEQRGAAWSRAVMGLKAKKIIIIGSMSSKNYIEKILKKCEDDYSIKEYFRKTPLEKYETKRKGKIVNDIKYTNLEKGDSVICFSRRDVYRLKEIIERKTHKKVSVVYGGLPPKTRTIEAKRFNEGETDILIATDSIGMGLNLNIKRIFFSTMSKYNGSYNELIRESLFKQISGRSGRFGKYEKGVVGLLNDSENRYFNYYEEKNNFNSLSKFLYTKESSISKGRFFPEFNHLNTFIENNNLEKSVSKGIRKYREYYYDRDNIFSLSSIVQFEQNTRIIEKSGFKLDVEKIYKLGFAPTKIKQNDLKEVLVLILNSKIEKNLLNRIITIKEKNTLMEIENKLHKINLISWVLNHIEEDKYKEVKLELLNRYEEGSIIAAKKLEESFQSTYI